MPFWKSQANLFKLFWSASPWCSPEEMTNKQVDRLQPTVELMNGATGFSVEYGVAQRSTNQTYSIPEGQSNWGTSLPQTSPTCRKRLRWRIRMSGRVQRLIFTIPCWSCLQWGHFQASSGASWNQDRNNISDLKFIQNIKKKKKGRGTALLCGFTVAQSNGGLGLLQGSLNRGMCFRCNITADTQIRTAFVQPLLWNICFAKR